MRDVNESSPGVQHPATMTLASARRAFDGEMARKNFTDASERTYRATLRRLAEYVGDDRPVDEITSHVCREFFDATFSDGQQPGTVNLGMTVVTRFFTFLVLIDALDVNPMLKVSRPKNIPSRDRKRVRITTEQVMQMIMACETWPEHVAINSFAFMGVRRTALSNLRWRDVDAKKWQATFREKGRKTIQKPVPHELRKVWTRYAIECGPFGPDDWVVPNRAPLGRTDTRSARFLYAIVQDVADRAGVRAHCHSFRAAFAVEFLRTYPDQLEACRRLLGHSSMQTTLIYVDELNDAELMQQVETISFAPKVIEAASTDMERAA